MLSIYLLSLVGTLLWIYFLWSRRRFYILMFQMPGPMGLPLIGIAAEYAINKSMRKILLYKSSIQYFFIHLQ